MKIGDRCFVHGYVDEIRKNTIIIRNNGGYFGTDPGEVIVVNNTAHPNWISVEDKMPDNNADVLLQFSNNMGVGFWEDGDWAVNTGDGIYSQIGYNEEKPIAWMPLPEPWRGGQDETIDTDALLKKLNDNSIEYDAYVNHFILNAPTVYAMPVIYAHWIPCENETGEGSNTYKCSACGGIQMIIDGTPKENGWAYCPHCGAKME